jgi:hypothetical protein
VDSPSRHATGRSALESADPKIDNASAREQAAGVPSFATAGYRFLGAAEHLSGRKNRRFRAPDLCWNVASDPAAQVDHSTTRYPGLVGF